MTFFAWERRMASMRLEWFSSSLKMTSPATGMVDTMPMFAMYPVGNMRPFL